MGEIRVRPLEAKDRPVWEELWHGYLTFYKVSNFSPDVTEATYSVLPTPYSLLP